jgi:tRNA (cmo5U34)-methyltransferase
LNTKLNDNLFEEEIKKSFEFDENVALVFDDMLARSVPFYEESNRLCTNLILANTQKDDKVYDIGCSTANTLINITLNTKHSLNLIGIDNSPAMIDRAKEKIDAYGYDISLINSDVFDVDMSNTQAIVANYTLQFIRPLKREQLLKKIYDSLEKNGIFICSEKLICEDVQLNKQLIDEYLLFKKNQGYSKTQIMQKRQALENILVPYSMNENMNLLKNVGFDTVDVVFRWANFAVFFARK